MAHLAFVLGVIWGGGLLPAFRRPAFLQFLVRLGIVYTFRRPSTPTVATAGADMIAAAPAADAARN